MLGRLQAIPGLLHPGRTFAISLSLLFLFDYIYVSSASGSSPEPNRNLDASFQGVKTAGGFQPGLALERVKFAVPELSMRLRGGGAPVVPGVAWSQREPTLLLKVDMPAGVSSPDALTVNEQSLLWKEGDVCLDMELFDKVDTDSVVKKSDGGRICTIEAKKAKKDWWPKLTSGKTPKNVRVDWGTWQDEDEAETEKYMPQSGGAGDMSGMGGMGGMGDGDFNFDDMDKGDDESPWVDDKEGSGVGTEVSGAAAEDGTAMPMEDGAEDKQGAAGEDDDVMPDA